MAKASRSRRLARLARWPLLAATVVATAGCALLTPLPDPVDLEGRLAAFPTRDLPLDGPVTVYWDAHQIPFVDAAHDGDAAFTLGLIHAHLRLGQLETARRLSQGRVAEMAGPIPFILDLDHSLRVLGLGRAAGDVLAAMPPETRDWVERFTAGLNHYLMTVEDLPHDFAILGLEREEWRPEEVLTIGRLAGADVNWLGWFRLLEWRDRPDFQELLARELDFGGRAPASSDLAQAVERTQPARDRALALLSEIIGGHARGSNSLALSGSRTASGAPMLANDPHLGVSQPNLWLIAGVRSPGYHVVGLMPTGLPFFALGRNPVAAWGGTNMRAASSDLVDVSDLDPATFETERHEIGVRYWFDTVRENRVTPYGPMLSDAPLLPFGPEEAVALRWVGHRPTDEITALLRAAQATDFASFRAAFESFAVSAQNMVYADANGTIGLVAATQIPRRDPGPPTALVHSPADVDRWWGDIATTADLPAIENPATGFIASANNPPGPTPFPLGYFFSSPDRVERMTELVQGRSDPWDFGALATLQQDTYSPGAVALRDALAALAPDGPDGLTTSQGNRPGPDAAALWAELTGWDGRYDSDSRGALVFQAVYIGLAEAIWPSSDPGRWDGGDGKWRVLDRVAASAPEDVRTALAEALDGAATALADGPTVWGDIHRLSVASILGNVPLIGGRYRFDNVPSGGSQETLLKSAHDETLEEHTVRYGAQARHISDLGDMDANYFVLLGGQDGWINSTTQLDQMDLWQAGRLIQVPLRVETVANQARMVLTLTGDSAPDS